MGEYLTHDLIIQILSWLPPESILRFRNANKLWYSTIRDPKFIDEHRSHFGNSQHGDNIVINYRRGAPGSGGVPSFKLYMLSDDNSRQRPHTNEFLDELGGEGHVMGSCNGLFSCMNGPPLDFSNNSRIFLCNPWIGRTVSIPSCPLVLEINRRPLAVNNCGIGFDSLNNDYKVLTISTTFNFHHRQAAVYSLNSRHWKIVDSPVPDVNAVAESVFLQGFIHWLCIGQLLDLSILLFDVCNETFDGMQLPEMTYGSGMSIHKVNGSLCVMDMNKGRDLSCVVWIMSEYGVVESWIKLFKVEYGCPLLYGHMTVGGKLIMGSPGGHAAARDGVLVHGDDDDGCPRGGCNGPPPYWQLILCDPETLEITNLCRSQSRPHVISAIPTLELLNYER